MISSPTPSRLDSYTIPLGLFVDRGLSNISGGGHTEGEEEEEHQEIVQFKGGGTEGGGNDWLSSERFERLFAMASPSSSSSGPNLKRNVTKRNVTKKRTQTPSSSPPSWKLW